MKKTLITFLSFLFALCTLSSSAQAPQKFNYQGIARDAKGNPLSNQAMTLKLTILPTADATIAEYEEAQMVNTNEFGLYTLQIGNGNPLIGSMKDVKWETGNKYIKVAIDPSGGTSYVDAGTSQLLSVPYAIYADKAGIAANGEQDKTRSGTVSTSGAGTGTINYLTKFTAANTIYNSQIYDNGTSIGIGTAAPAAAAKLHFLTTTGNIEHIRMQNTNSTGFGKFIMYNDVASNYATFTKYGSAIASGYPGIASQYPYANMLAFGNNLGPFLLANNGNVGIGIVTAGLTKLYLNAQQSSGYLGIGGNALPASNVHINNNTAGDTLRITNSATGHLKTDGLEIRNTNNAAWITNKEAAELNFGTSDLTRMTIDAAGNVGIGTNSPAALLHVNGDVRVNGRIYAPGHVVQTVIATSSTTASANWNAFQEVDSNYRITITPAFANSILLIEYSFFINNAMNPNTIYQMQLIRDITGTAIPVGVGPANGLRSPVTFVGRPGNGFDGNDVFDINMVAKDTVLQAGTPVTYGFKYRQETGGAGTAYFNYSFGNSDVYGWSGLVTMKITEIAQ